MKIRNGFVSNSSSSSFIITNNTDKPLTLLDFVNDTPFLVERYNGAYGYGVYKNQEDMIECAKKRMAGSKLWVYPDCADIFYPGDNPVIFGDEQGDLIGLVYDYMLRCGGMSRSGNFTWEYVESLH